MQPTGDSASVKRVSLPEDAMRATLCPIISLMQDAKVSLNLKSFSCLVIFLCGNGEKERISLVIKRFGQVAINIRKEPRSNERQS